MLHDFRQSPGAASHHRAAVGHGFDRDKAEAFGSGGHDSHVEGLLKIRHVLAEARQNHPAGQSGIPGTTEDSFGVNRVGRGSCQEKPELGALPQSLLRRIQEKILPLVRGDLAHETDQNLLGFHPQGTTNPGPLGRIADRIRPNPVGDDLDFARRKAWPRFQEVAADIAGNRHHSVQSFSQDPVQGIAPPPGCRGCHVPRQDQRALPPYKACQKQAVPGVSSPVDMHNVSAGCG